MSGNKPNMFAHFAALVVGVVAGSMAMNGVFRAVGVDQRSPPTR